MSDHHAPVERERDDGRGERGERLRWLTSADQLVERFAEGEARRTIGPLIQRGRCGRVDLAVDR